IVSVVIETSPKCAGTAGGACPGLYWVELALRHRGGSAVLPRPKAAPAKNRANALRSGLHWLRYRRSGWHGRHGRQTPCRCRNLLIFVRCSGRLSSLEPVTAPPVLAIGSPRAGRRCRVFGSSRARSAG